jgi:hypothetical protein
MTRINAIAIYIALMVAPAMLAHAQPVSNPDATYWQTQRSAASYIHCAHQEGGASSLQPCRTRQSDDTLRIASNVTRQEFECVLSGKCGEQDRTRVNG